MKTLFFLIIILALFGETHSQSDLITRKETRTTAAKDPLRSLDELEIKKTDLKIPTYEELNNWKLITMSDDLKKGAAFLYKTSHRSSAGDVEAWVKSIPFDLSTYRKYGVRDARYAMQFMTLHCVEHRYSLESTLVYNSKDAIVARDRLADRQFRLPVIPESVIENIYDHFCH